MENGRAEIFNQWGRHSGRSAQPGRFRECAETRNPGPGSYLQKQEGGLEEEGAVIPGMVTYECSSKLNQLDFLLLASCFFLLTSSF
jgi:hypothetical protein